MKLLVILTLDEITSIDYIDTTTPRRQRISSVRGFTFVSSCANRAIWLLIYVVYTQKRLAASEQKITFSGGRLCIWLWSNILKRLNVARNTKKLDFCLPLLLQNRASYEEETGIERCTKI
jgi:hypothetical protein